MFYFSIFLILAFALAGLALLVREIIRRAGDGSATTGLKLARVEPRKYFFSKAERSFFEVLRQVAEPRYYVFAKVRLIDLLSVLGGSPDAARTRNRIISKHVDFVLCDRERMQVRGVVELDDSSHERPDRRDRDALVDQLLTAANIRIIRIRAASANNTRELAGELGGLQSET